MGTAVTVGIILAAFVISVFLVPAVTALIGQPAWWPGRIDRPLAGHVSEPDQLGRVEPTGNGSARSRSTRL
jgi:RND superfamily putative drug exporter